LSEPNTNLPLVTEEEFAMADIHEVSLSLLDTLEELDVDVPLGAAGVALTLGRALAPKILEAEEEMKWLKAVMEFAQLYWVEGKVN
jgi:hypothetical protein